MAERGLEELSDNGVDGKVRGTRLAVLINHSPSPEPSVLPSLTTCCSNPRALPDLCGDLSWLDRKLPGWQDGLCLHSVVLMLSCCLEWELKGGLGDRAFPPHWVWRRH